MIFPENSALNKTGRVKAGDLEHKIKLNVQLNGIYEMRIEHMGWRVNKRIAIIQN